MPPDAQPSFPSACVLLDLAAESKPALIRHMVQAVAKAVGLEKTGEGLSEERLIEAVLTREAEIPTGAGNGVAFPHARIAGCDRLLAAFARLRTPLDFGGPDGRPARFVFLLILPGEHPQIALKVMARAARICSTRGERAILEYERDPKSLARYLSLALLAEETPILARDLMRAPKMDIYDDMLLHEVTLALVQKDADASSVVTRDGTLVGEITSYDLFRIGMPDFFTQLKSIAFIREFDPFDDYFKFEPGATARDIMTTDYAALPEDATLLEVVFELAVKRHPKVYVVRDGKRIGIIDATVVLTKVINI